MPRSDDTHTDHTYKPTQPFVLPEAVHLIEPVAYSVEYLLVGRMPDRLASRKPSAFRKLFGFPYGVWPGLEVSLGQFFQDRFIQHEIRYDLLELGVFLFEFLELLGLV